MNSSKWNTYEISGYSHQAGTDARATGSVQLKQVRRCKSAWQRRTVDSNGRFRSAGIARVISDAEGEALFERAKSY